MVGFELPQRIAAHISTRRNRGEDGGRQGSSAQISGLLAHATSEDNGLTFP
jgi:hypothetical protein